MEEIIKKIAKIFRKLKIPYVIIGGISASIWGRPRMTLDTDIVFFIQEEKIDSFLNLLKEEKFKVYPVKKIKEKLKTGLPVKIAYTKHFSIDLRLSTYKIDENAIKRAKVKKLFNVPLKICSPEDLIIYKLLRFDEIDIFDIKNIILRRGKKLDWEYIDKEVKELAKETSNENLIKNLEIIKNL